MNREYQKTFERLNSEQKKAVTSTEGPLLVVAGPGTGKTELLSSRVAYILQNTDTKAENILCLTFTNKAAVNMKERIISQAGPSGAKVIASTFHSFAAEVMNLYPDYFWNAARLAIAPDTLQLDVVESIISELPLDNPLALKFAGQYTLLSQIQQAIRLVKEAGLTPDKLRALIEGNLAYIDLIEADLVNILDSRLNSGELASLQSRVDALPVMKISADTYPILPLSEIISETLSKAIAADEGSGKATNTSKWKARWVQTVAGEKGMFAEKERNSWWLELANVYEKYRARLHERKFYDYSDMLVEVITQLEQNPGMLADIQERFNYVLIDEFQDSNPAQLRLAHLVADHFSSEGKPNLMAVGDDDQTIYKFNGAELSNMLNFKRTYPDAHIVILKDNYRSTQAILDIAKKVIEQASNRLVDSDPAFNKNLIAKNPPQKGKVQALAYSSQDLQMSRIAEMIKANYSPDRQIAVLARGHESLVKMSGLLRQLKVPIRYEQSSNILDHELIDQVLLLSRLMLAIQNGDNKAVDSLIHQIIRWPAWGVPPNKLWQVALAHGPKGWMSALLKSPSRELKALGVWFVDLAARVDSQPLAVTIEQIIGLRQTGTFHSPIRDYLTKLSSDDPNSYFHGLSAIQLIRALVYEFAAETEPTLAEFVRFIEINKENGVVVADESPFITGAHAVQLLTVHKAKGLEFDNVYIIDAVEDNWRPRAGRRRTPSNLPLQPALDDFDDYVRLMYVALSRAKSSLTVSAYRQDHSGKDVAISTIVQSAFEIEDVSENNRQKLVAVLEQNLLWPSLAGGDEKQMLKSRLSEYNLYATHLLNFLDVSRGGPQYFKERNLLYLPELTTASMAYGTAMHSALETAQQLVNRGAYSLAAVKKQFKVALVGQQLPDTDYTRYLAQGSTSIERLFNKFDYRLPKGSRTEQKHKDIIVGNARIGGLLDRVDSLDGQINIVDYKTGRPLSNFSTRDKSKAIRAYRHKLQLVFYALLISREQSVKPGSISGEMVYVEAEELKNLSRTYTPSAEDIQRLEKLINAVWQKITSLDLPDAKAYSPDIDGILAFEEDLLSGKI